MSDNENENNTPNEHEPFDFSEEVDQADRTMDDDLADLAQKCAELEAKLLRAHADYQNFARRSQLNVTAAKDQQTGEIARDLLPVLDHFDSALAVDPEKATAQSLLEGITMVRDELMRTLGRHGITRITAAKGDEFDPNIHEALMRQKVEGIATNHVVAQLQSGYLLGERTLRPVKVSVAE